MLRGTLLFLAGLLVGANLVYFLMTRAATRAVPASPGIVATTPPAPSAATGEQIAQAPAAQASPPPPAAPAATGTSLPPTAIPAAAPAAALMMPVSGVAAAQLSDTYNDTRGSGSRTHEALDIMAPRGTPVVAAVDGTVAKLFTSDAGGLTVYQFDPTSTYAYYYAHLDAYAPGLKEGQPLRRGDAIGTVGSTGNASPDGPHLHFAIFLLGPEKKWSEGTPVNPYPLLSGR